MRVKTKTRQGTYSEKLLKKLCHNQMPVLSNPTWVTVAIDYGWKTVSAAQPVLSPDEMMRAGEGS